MPHDTSTEVGEAPPPPDQVLPPSTQAATPGAQDPVVDDKKKKRGRKPAPSVGTRTSSRVLRRKTGEQNTAVQLADSGTTVPTANADGEDLPPTDEIAGPVGMPTVVNTAALPVDPSIPVPGQLLVVDTPTKDTTRSPMQLNQINSVGTGESQDDRNKDEQMRRNAVPDITRGVGSAVAIGEQVDNTSTHPELASTGDNITHHSISKSAVSTARDDKLGAASSSSVPANDAAGAPSTQGDRGKVSKDDDSPMDEDQPEGVQAKRKRHPEPPNAPQTKEFTLTAAQKSFADFAQECFMSATCEVLNKHDETIANQQETESMRMASIRRIYYLTHYKMFGSYVPGDPSPEAVLASAASKPDLFEQPFLRELLEDMVDDPEPESEEETNFKATPGPFKKEDVALVHEKVDDLFDFLRAVALRTNKSLPAVVHMAGIYLKFGGRKASLWNLFQSKWAHNNPPVAGQTTKDRQAERRAAYHDATDHLDDAAKVAMRKDLQKWADTYSAQLAELDQEQGNLWKRMIHARDIIKPLLNYLANNYQFIVVGAIISIRPGDADSAAANTLFATDDHIRDWLEKQGVRIRSLLSEVATVAAARRLSGASSLSRYSDEELAAHVKKGLDNLRNVMQKELLPWQAKILERPDLRQLEYKRFPRKLVEKKLRVINWPTGVPIFDDDRSLWNNTPYAVALVTRIYRTGGLSEVADDKKICVVPWTADEIARFRAKTGEAERSSISVWMDDSGNSLTTVGLIERKEHEADIVRDRIAAAKRAEQDAKFAADQAAEIEDRRNRIATILRMLEDDTTMKTTDLERELAILQSVEEEEQYQTELKALNARHQRSQGSSGGTRGKGRKTKVPPRSSVFVKEEGNYMEVEGDERSDAGSTSAAKRPRHDVIDLTTSSSASTGFVANSSNGDASTLEGGAVPVSISRFIKYASSMDASAFSTLNYSVDTVSPLNNQLVYPKSNALDVERSYGGSQGGNHGLLNRRTEMQSVHGTHLPGAARFPTPGLIRYAIAPPPRVAPLPSLAAIASHNSLTSLGPLPLVRPVSYGQSAPDPPFASLMDEFSM